MNLKTMIAVAAVAASTVAPAATFKWTVNTNEGVASWDTIWLNAYTDATDTNGNLVGAPDQYGNSGWSYAKGKDMSFAFNRVDSDGKAYMTGKDGVEREVKYIKFGLYGNGTYIGNTSESGFEWDNTILKWEDVWNGIKNGGSYTTDLKYTLKEPWEPSKVGTVTLSLPEPTSGLMLLLGAGMLALRRKAVRA